jgi:hypothetical protein
LLADVTLDIANDINPHFKRRTSRMVFEQGGKATRLARASKEVLRLFVCDRTMFFKVMEEPPYTFILKFVDRQSYEPATSDRRLSL